MQIFITVSINKVPQIYQIELGFEDVRTWIYIELIKTLICMCVHFLFSVSYVTTTQAAVLSIFCGEKKFPGYINMQNNTLTYKYMYMKKTYGHFIQLKGNVYFKFLAVKSSSLYVDERTFSIQLFHILKIVSMHPSHQEIAFKKCSFLIPVSTVYIFLQNGSEYSNYWFLYKTDSQSKTCSIAVKNQ